MPLMVQQVPGAQSMGELALEHPNSLLTSSNRPAGPDPPSSPPNWTVTHPEGALSVRGPIPASCQPAPHISESGGRGLWEQSATGRGEHPTNRSLDLLEHEDKKKQTGLVFRYHFKIRSREDTPIACTCPVAPVATFHSTPLVQAPTSGPGPRPVGWLRWTSTCGQRYQVGLGLRVPVHTHQACQLQEPHDPLIVSRACNTEKLSSSSRLLLGSQKRWGTSWQGADWGRPESGPHLCREGLWHLTHKGRTR